MPRDTDSLYKPSNVKAVANARVVGFRPVIPPSLLQEELPITEEISSLVISTREQISNILNLPNKLSGVEVDVEDIDDRLVIVVGPCSIHDYSSALDYASQLLSLASQYSSTLLVVMRVYFEKPRTTVGWKGLINDPKLDGSFEINKGLRLARKLLLEINELGLPCGTEFLDAISPQFTGDLVGWGAIGARTTESQIHRELASGLSCPIGFKNGTSGTVDSVKIAIEAVISASEPHHFLGVNDQGLAAIVKTTGNPSCHVILRGGSAGTNYGKEFVKDIVKEIKEAKDGGEITSLAGIMIDCSHGNSGKNHENQIMVVRSVADQIRIADESSKFLVGLMIESNILAGKQSLKVGVTKREDLLYGMSVTDACVDLKTTAEMFKLLHDAVLERRSKLNIVV